MNKKYCSTLISYFFIIGIAGCSGKIDWRRLTYYREIDKNTLNRIKTNGIFYSVIPKGCWPYDKGGEKDAEDGVIWFVLYEDGFYLSNDRDSFGSPTNSPNLPAAIKKYLVWYNKRQNNLPYQNSINYWGAYVVRQDSILFQEAQGYTSWSGFAFRKARIINDTTFEMDLGFCFADRGLVKKFTLIKTNDKPDSVNPFNRDGELKRKLDELYEKRHSYKRGR